MRKIYCFVAFALVFSTLSAQSVLYTNSFDSPGGFTLEAGSYNAWVINNVYLGGALFSGSLIPTVPSQPTTFTNPNQNYLHPSSPLALSANLQPITNANYVAGSGAANYRAVMNTSVNAANFNNITVSFYRVGGLNGMKLIYSINGGQTWQDAGLFFQGSPTAWTQETVTINALNGQTNVRIGFEMMEAQLADPAPNPYHSIDELKITGTPIPTSEVTMNLSVPATGFCSGQSVSASYQVVSGTINTGNVFSLELSDAAGSFTSPTVIGTLTGTQTSGTINGNLPGTISGNNFRMRVSSSNAAIVGNNNGSDFVITQSPSAPIITLNTTAGQLQVSTGAPSYVWQFNGSNIANSQNQTVITPAANGSYTVIATSGSCSTISSIYTVNFVGLELTDLPSLFLFPNPFERTLTIQYEHFSNSSLTITDISGTVVFSDTENLETIDLSHLKSGVYFIQINGNKFQTARVMKL